MREWIAPIVAVLALLAMPAASAAPAESAGGPELECLALNVYWEARSESARHQQAIAHVTLNRVADPRFPKTICGVVRQSIKGRKGGCQFSWWCDGERDWPTDQEAWAEAIRNAKHALAHRGSDPSRGALFYHHTSVRPHWAAKKRRTVQIDSHIFYK